MKTLSWHIITCEYPPQFGGVSDYTRTLAEGLVKAGDEVHVWAPQWEGLLLTPEKNVNVHRELGRFSRADLKRAGKLLDQFPGPRRLLVQWVPHGYGYRSMNIDFCRWLGRRARQGDRVEIMVHEPYLAFWEGSWKQNAVALIHRLMTIILLRAAAKVWISIVAWEDRLKPYAFGRSLNFDWLPPASNVEVVNNPGATRAARVRYVTPGGFLVGHFGSYDVHTTAQLHHCVPGLLQQDQANSLLLIGKGSDALRMELLREHPALSSRLHATGALPEGPLSAHLSACDLMVQPYIDGISSRRTTALAALAHGVPLVTTVGRLTDPLWIDESPAALVPVTDGASELAAKTQQLLEDRAKRSAMATSSRSFYSRYFDLNRSIEKLRG